MHEPVLPRILVVLFKRSAAPFNLIAIHCCLYLKKRTTNSVA